ncbi:hypothetical protein EYZ11_011182 [Aspergillus tanneri]|uniref:Uncharacterized protein n=1 Tax=Aspergillus tanneri TaxID=1220188 RepID=A0A4S3J3I4_9EURO|nr:hypothetical protein EYZ11_011182 [Aspergillus tanneri]
MLHPRNVHQAFNMGE